MGSGWVKTNSIPRARGDTRIDLPSNSIYRAAAGLHTWEVGGLGAGGAGLLGGVLRGMSFGSTGPTGCPTLQLWLPEKVGGCCLLIWSPGACWEGGLGGISGKAITCAEEPQILMYFLFKPPFILVMTLLRIYVRSKSHRVENIVCSTSMRCVCLVGAG